MARPSNPAHVLQRAMQLDSLDPRHPGGLSHPERPARQSWPIEPAAPAMRPGQRPAWTTRPAAQPRLHRWLQRVLRPWQHLSRQSSGSPEALAATGFGRRDAPTWFPAAALSPRRRVSTSAPPPRCPPYRGHQVVWRALPRHPATRARVAAGALGAQSAANHACVGLLLESGPTVIPVPAPLCVPIRSVQPGAEVVPRTAPGGRLLPGSRHSPLAIAPRRSRAVPASDCLPGPLFHRPAPCPTIECRAQDPPSRPAETWLIAAGMSDRPLK